MLPARYSKQSRKMFERSLGSILPYGGWMRSEGGRGMKTRQGADHGPRRVWALFSSSGWKDGGHVWFHFHALCVCVGGGEDATGQADFWRLYSCDA